MKNQTIHLIIFTLILFACSSQQKANNEVAEQKQVEEKPLKKNLLDNLQIPKSWTEITFVNGAWTYSIPCRNDRELRTIDLTKVDEQEAVYFYWGTGGQWHTLEKIETQGDSLVLETFLPYDDTTSIVRFSLKYLDKEKNIVRWGADGTYCTYIPTQDTTKYNRILQPCNED